MTCALVLSTGAAQAQTVKIALDSAADMENSGPYVWVHTFGQYLQEHGFEVEEFERGALGGEAERLDQVQQGLLEISSSDTKGVAALAPVLTPMTLPFVFPGIEAMDRALASGILDDANAAATVEGVRILGFSTLGGPVGIFNTQRTINSAADMAGLRMRALDEAQIAIYGLWGTTGTIVAWDEVPNALQTGIADGYVNPPLVPILFGHTGFIRYFTDARISIGTRTVIASEDWYQSLSNEQRQIVGEAAAAATAASRAWHATRSAELQMLRDNGIEVTELSEEAWNEFRTLSMPVYSMVPMPEGTMDRWFAAIAE
ncbi:TRAP transporter substrate-binding protein [Thalassobius vesicularis]|uniref:TRAP transporter substrate-binding protein n=2 Tax=Thalassobius vesicularis TaxID=1294297 RepID=A0A4S3M5Z8_9RHOB|nr:TRAP transporter substrate-binding protein [Thalassobius vesicularis]